MNRRYVGEFTPTTIFDVLKNIGQAKQEQARGQYAADILKSTLLQNQLSNQKSQALLPYVAPHEQANISALQAKEALERLQSQYIPTKYSQEAQRLGIAQGNLDIAKQRFSPEQLKALLDWRNAQTQNAPKRGLTAFGKGILEQQALEQGRSPLGQPLNASQEERQQLINQYKLKRVKDTTDSALRQAFPQIQSIDKTLESINLPNVAQYYGYGGRKKALKDFAYSQKTGITPPEYKDYRYFMNTAGPSLAAQMRQFLKDSVTPGAQEHLREIIFPSKWMNNPEMAFEQFQNLKKLFDIEKSTRIEAANNPEIYQGLPARHKEKIKKLDNELGMHMPMPKFRNAEDFRKWKEGLSSEELSHYKSRSWR